jgi:hypothetical protein
VRVAIDMDAIIPMDTYGRDIPAEGGERGGAGQPSGDANAADHIPDLPENARAREFLKSAPSKGLWMPLGQVRPFNFLAAIPATVACRFA